MERQDTMDGRNRLMRPLWISRPLKNWQDICAWAQDAGIRKIIPPEHLHLTLATVREPVDHSRVTAQEDEIIIETGHMPVQIFAWTIKALTFTHPRLTERHAELLHAYPSMDHPDFRPHLSLYKGGRMPRTEYSGSLVFGPERILEFDADNSKGIKHAKVTDLLGETQ